MFTGSRPFMVSVPTGLESRSSIELKERTFAKMIPYNLFLSLQRSIDRRVSDKKGAASRILKKISFFVWYFYS